MLSAVFKILRETMVGTDNGCKVLSKFSSPCGATVKAETDVVRDPVNAVPFCSKYSPNNSCIREILNYLSVSVC